MCRRQQKLTLKLDMHLGEWFLLLLQTNLKTPKGSLSSNQTPTKFYLQQSASSKLNTSYTIRRHVLLTIYIQSSNSTILPTYNFLSILSNTVIYNQSSDLLLLHAPKSKKFESVYVLQIQLYYSQITTWREMIIL